MLAIGQHQGLATGLLDWSCSPLTAAYFSAFNHNGTDAALLLFSGYALSLSKPFIRDPTVKASGPMVAWDK
ncbi:FRG domain-containing protein [Shewanella salipaludis]|uniref:FRG domain-containing protein n=1 Tax=Shewanella salipaludis TaxID=2723052 RepID=UPI003CC80AD1